MLAERRVVDCQLHHCHPLSIACFESCLDPQNAPGCPFRAAAAPELQLPFAPPIPVVPEHQDITNAGTTPVTQPQASCHPLPLRRGRAALQPGGQPPLSVRIKCHRFNNRLKCAGGQNTNFAQTTRSIVSQNYDRICHHLMSAALSSALIHPVQCGPWSP